MSTTADIHQISLKFSRKSRVQISDYTGHGFNPFYSVNWENTISSCFIWNPLQILAYFISYPTFP